jgi:aryl-alcohol dehydrogenase-like predicted oxidoreductase
MVWLILAKKDSSKYVAAKGSVPMYQIYDDVHQNKKHKLDEQHMDSNKRLKTKHTGRNIKLFHIDWI